ncbi:relaxase domain-containing protein, partial [Vibrio mediterranei]|uniref:relaxase domain-containing protein n=1 Tax=Vibrio mediterranei TaxID=689 RepID=UPI00148BB1F0
MMSISPLRSAAGAAEYYLKEEKDLNQSNLSLEQDNNDNYYLKEKSAEPNSFWHGKLAEEAGLLGKPVEQAALESVLSGNLGEETIKGKRDDHKSGLDLTLSAPKGLSILALVGGDTRL